MILGAEWIGHEELRPHAINQAVPHDGQHGFAAAGDFLHDALAVMTALAGIEYQQAARTRRAMVAAGHAYHLVHLARHRLGVEERCRKPRPAAAELALVRAVRIHVEEHARIGVGLVGVFPTLIEHAPVVQHRRAPVAVLLEGQLADFPAAGIQLIEADHLASAELAGQPLIDRGGGEDHAAVRQIARIEMADISAIVGGDLVQVLAVHADFKNPPVPLAGTLFGKHQAPGIKMQHRIDQRLQVFCLIERRGFGLAAQPAHHGELVVPAPLSWNRLAGVGIERADAQRVAHGLTRLFGIGEFAFEDEQTVAVEQRIG